MNSREIFCLLKSDGVLKKIFLGVFPSDMLPTKVSHYPAALVINLDPHDQPGSHWVAVYLDSQGKIDYFDSYGRKPNLENIEKFISNAKYKHNSTPVQRLLTATCGQFCIYFLIWRARGVPMEQIITSLLHGGDEYVTGFVNGMFRTNTLVYDEKYLINQIAKNYIKQSE